MKGKTSISSSQQDLKGFFHPAAGSSTDGEAPMKYKQTSPRQKLISGEIVNFIVGSSLPLSIVEDKHFRSLLQVLDPRYNYLFVLVYLCFGFSPNYNRKLNNVVFHI